MDIQKKSNEFLSFFGVKVGVDSWSWELCMSSVFAEFVEWRQVCCCCTAVLLRVESCTLLTWWFNMMIISWLSWLGLWWLWWCWWWGMKTSVLHCGPASCWNLHLFDMMIMIMTMMIIIFWFLSWKKNRGSSQSQDQLMHLRRVKTVNYKFCQYIRIFLPEICF